MNDRPAQPPRMKPELLVKLLAAGVLFYVPVQWVAGRHPGSTTIFSTHREAVRQGFTEAASALRARLAAGCADGSIRTVYFSDGDVYSPYFLNDLAKFPGCRVIRQTDVTPVDRQTELGCGRFLVDERVLSAWKPGLFWEDPGPLQDKLTVVGAYPSGPDGYGWKLLTTNGCPGSGRDAG